MCLQDPSQLSRGPRQLFYRTSSNYLHDPSKVFTGPQAICYLAPSIFLQGPNQSSRGPQQMFYRNLSNYDRIQVCTGTQTFLQYSNQFATLNNYLEDSSNCSTGYHPIVCRSQPLFYRTSTFVSLLGASRCFIGPQQLFYMTLPIIYRTPAIFVCPHSIC